MRWRALATDYDGTLATERRVPDRVWGTLERLVATGRKVVLVSGRELDDLERIGARIDLFDAVVAENGAVVYRASTRKVRLLAEAAPPRFAAALRARGVPLGQGRAIVATHAPHEQCVLDVIEELGLDLHVIRNKGALMVLPRRVDKASGLEAALRDVGSSFAETVGVGDAENDLAFLERCGYRVAVASALLSVRERCDLVTSAPDGEGIVELVERILSDELP